MHKTLAEHVKNKGKCNEKNRAYVDSIVFNPTYWRSDEALDRAH